MKKAISILFFLVAAQIIIAQGTTRLTVIGILPFEASGAGVFPGDAADAARLIAAELNTWGFFSILEGEAANNAEYLINGQVTRQNNQITLNATASEARTGRNLTTARQQGQTIQAIPMEEFCTQLTENIPFPNYLVGRWQSTINMVDGPVTCILEFNSNRTIRVLQYDTWEHNGTNILKYQGIGTGTYSYAGYRRRMLNISGRGVLADATVGINLSLEDALPNYISIRRSGMRVLFDDAKDNFELSSGGFPCGDNLSGPSVYPGSAVYYTKFVKIQ